MRIKVITVVMICETRSLTKIKVTLLIFTKLSEARGPKWEASTANQSHYTSIQYFSRSDNAIGWVWVVDLFNLELKLEMYSRL